MLSYMDYVLRCYDVANQWDDSNLYPSVIATPKALLDFNLPNGLSFNINKKSSPQSANSFHLSNVNSINGSLSYFFSSSYLTNVLSSELVKLQDSIQTYQFIDSLKHNNSKNNFFKNSEPNKNALLYGKLNFPSNILEGLLVKNFSQNSRILIKCLSTNSNLFKNHGVLTFYFQKNYPKYSNEFIYSTNENLVGFRHLYNFNLNNSNDTFQLDDDQENNITNNNNNKNLYDNSKLSVGTEIWYGITNMTPGISNSLRYSTYSTYSGKPLTITLSCNPIIGLISSTYTVKTSLNSTFCSKYNFNVYSYESDLILGCELWNFNKGNINDEISRILQINKTTSNKFKKLIKQKKIPDPLLNPTMTNNNPSLSNIEKFKDLYKTIPFSGVIKLSTSLSEKNFKVLWEGKYNGLLMNIGFELLPFQESENKILAGEKENLKKKENSVFKGPSLGKFGISLQFNS